jgi:ABC-type Na+ efflux pump permease subunit
VKNTDSITNNKAELRQDNRHFVPRAVRHKKNRIINTKKMSKLFLYLLTNILIPIIISILAFSYVSLAYDSIIEVEEKLVQILVPSQTGTYISGPGARGDIYFNSEFHLTNQSEDTLHGILSLDPLSSDWSSSDFIVVDEYGKEYSIDALPIDIDVTHEIISNKYTVFSVEDRTQVAEFTINVTKEDLKELEDSIKVRPTGKVAKVIHFIVEKIP